MSNAWKLLWFPVIFTGRAIQAFGILCGFGDYDLAMEVLLDDPR